MSNSFSSDLDSYDIVSVISFKFLLPVCHTGPILPLRHTYPHNKHRLKIFYHSSLSLTLQNPGFFDFAIYTDDLEKASSQLKKFLKYYLPNYKKHPNHSLKEDPTYHQVVKEKIKGFTEQINHSSSKMAEQLNFWKK